MVSIGLTFLHKSRVTVTIKAFVFKRSCLSCHSPLAQDPRKAPPLLPEAAKSAPLMHAIFRLVKPAGLYFAGKK